MIAPLLNYMILPILLAGIIARENPISETIQNILTVLILCLVNLFTGQLIWVFSFLIYACSFLVIFNLLVVVKRIFRVIDTDMNK